MRQRRRNDARNALASTIEINGLFELIRSEFLIDAGPDDAIERRISTAIATDSAGNLNAGYTELS